MKRYEKALNIVLPIITVGAIILIWVVAAASADNSFVLPTVGETFAAAFKLFARGEFYRAFFTTLLRSLIAFAISFALAFGAAWLSYKFKLAAKALQPLIVIIRVLPTVAVVLLLVLWSTSRVAAVIVTMLVIFPTLFENIFAALNGIDNELVEMCSVFNVDKKTTLSKVVLPMVAPEFIAAVGAGITLSLKLMVAAEVLAHTPRSMGYMLNTAKEYFEIPEMMALVLITVVAGLIIGLTFKFLSEKARKP